MANILKQIKVGNTTYNIEPYTAYLPLYDLGNTTFKVTRGASQSTKNTGYWAGMLNSGQEGSPTLPSTGAWWHVISMDWTSVDSNNWISQLALPTQHGGVPHYRRNNSTDTSIDNSTWHAFITDENIGSQNVNYANSAGSVAWGNVTGKPDLTDKTYVDTQLGNVRNSISGLGSALNNKADKGHTHSYLPLSGGSMTGTLDLASSSNGIKFNSTSYYVTNMESGSVDVTLGYALGNETSKTVSFHGGSKGSGTWHVVAQADGVLSDNVSIGVTSISNTGFTIWVKNVLAGSSSRTLRLHYIAVKYY